MEIKLPATVTITNTTKEAMVIVPYAQNFTVKIPGVDAENEGVNVLAIDVLNCAAEVMYYLGQAREGLTVTQTAKVEAE